MTSAFNQLGTGILWFCYIPRAALRNEEQDFRLICLAASFTKAALFSPCCTGCITELQPWDFAGFLAINYRTSFHHFWKWVCNLCYKIEYNGCDTKVFLNICSVVLCSLFWPNQSYNSFYSISRDPKCKNLGLMLCFIWLSHWLKASMTAKCLRSVWLIQLLAAGEAAELYCGEQWGCSWEGLITGHLTFRPC